MQVVRISPFLKALLCVVIVVVIAFIKTSLLNLVTRRSSSAASSSVWMFRVPNGLQMVPVKKVAYRDVNFETGRDFDETKSPYILGAGMDKTGTVYTEHKPVAVDRPITIGYYDPNRELKFLSRTFFNQCEYDKCVMTEDVEAADAVLFLIARLTRVGVPEFRRKPGQIWIVRTDEAPSRFSWFESLNRTGLKEQMNWTITHKLDSDIPFVYGRLIRDEHPKEKDYDKIYEGKTRTAAWFVSHCPVRSDRLIYVHKMQNRTDVDIFGKCGPLSCGMAEKVPGVQEMRKQADQTMCFPMLSSSYKFYLAFENSLCQEYISEKFFKIFMNVDVIPVVRGGADYKSYFPSDIFIDAADFSTPEALADYLDDLGNDKDRYLTYLRNKDRYRSVLDFPDWPCQMCEKLHTDRTRHTYTDVHRWWVMNSCHDPVDTAKLF